MLATIMVLAAGWMGGVNNWLCEQLITNYACAAVQASNTDHVELYHHANQQSNLCKNVFVLLERLALLLSMSI